MRTSAYTTVSHAALGIALAVIIVNQTYLLKDAGQLVGLGDLQLVGVGAAIVYMIQPYLWDAGGVVLDQINDRIGGSA